MIDYRNVQNLNSKNISISNATTGVRIGALWAAASKKSRHNIIEIGGYANARPIHRAKSTGLISVRMVVAMALALNISPYFLTGESDDKANCTEEELIRFVRAWGFNLYIQADEGDPSRDEVLTYIEKVMGHMTSEKRQKLEELSVSDIKAMIDSPMIRMDIDKSAKLKLFIIKALLTSED